jgi:hypothetical protein
MVMPEVVRAGAWVLLGLVGWTVASVLLGVLLGRWLRGPRRQGPAAGAGGAARSRWLVA